jgi:hypothetical protein
MANVIPVDHGAILHRKVPFQKPASNTSINNAHGYHSTSAERGQIPNGGRQSSRTMQAIQVDRFRTTDARDSALNN